jgi:hypothetical protein
MTPGRLTGNRLMAGWVAGREVLTRPNVLTAARMLGGRAVPPGPGAVPHPDRTGPQHAPEFAAAWRVDPVTGPQREVLRLTRQVSAVARRHMQSGRGLAMSRRAAGTRPVRCLRHRAREPVVRIRPRCGLFGIGPRGGQPVREIRQLITAALANHGERHRIPGQAQGDLIWPADPVTAAHRLDGQDGAINAT